MNSEVFSNLSDGGFNLTLRGAVLSILIVFAVSTFLAFTLYIDLQPAQALFGVDAAIKIAFDIAKAVAKAIALMLAVKISMDLLARLESNHTIRNILYYADVLGADQYLGDFLNKITSKGSEPVTDPNTGEELANLPPSKTWDELIAEVDEEAPGFPDLTESDAEKLGFFERPLSPEAEASLTRVGIALLTSDAQCGGTNNLKLVRNIAIYNAARVLGFNPRTISVVDGAGFYQKLGLYGVPFANSHFQELNLRDVASGAEAEARRAAELELLSSGTKALRQQDFAISRTSATVVDFIQQHASSAQQAAIESSDNFFIRSIVSTVLNIAQAVIFTPGGVTLNERSICDSTQTSTSRGYAKLKNYTDPDPAFITANGVTVLEIEAGESVDLNWSIGGHIFNPGSVGTAEITKVGPVDDVGTVTVKPTEDTIYELSIMLDPSVVIPGDDDDEDSREGPGGPGGVRGAHTEVEDQRASGRLPIASATVTIREGADSDSGSEGGTNSGGLGNDIPNPPNLKPNFSNVVWIDRDISSWSKTATLGAVNFTGHDGITLDYDKANTWPRGSGSNSGVVGNAWICVFRKDSWYCGTWEWLRPGQTQKSRENLENSGVLGQLDSEKELTNFVAQSGDHYYFLVSGLARDGSTSVSERSNLVRVVWP